MPSKYIYQKSEKRGAQYVALSNRPLVGRMEDLVEDLKKPWLERFWLSVKKGGPDECWEWTAHTNNGYGRLSINYFPYRAHRLAFLIAHGEINPHLLVLHSCDNKLCCNPRHLSQGTTQKNSEEAKSRGLYRIGSGNGRSKLIEEDVRKIRGSDETGVEMAKRYGVSTTVIGFVRRRKSWKHIA